jgi:hypothetical protein
MDSMTFSPSSWSNLMIDRNHISFGTIDFLPHPPTLVPVFANLEWEMDLMFRSLNFRFRSLGSLRHSDPIYSGPPASKTVATATLESSVGSSSEAKKTRDNHEMQVRWVHVTYNGPLDHKSGCA